MKIVFLSFLILALVVFLFLAVTNTYYSLMITSEKLWVRNMFKKHAIKLLHRKMKEVENIPFPVFIELHFNKRHYENMYVKEGFEGTIDYLFERTVKHMQDIEGDSEIKMYKMEIEDE